jgi:proliferating cell nuclear antigen
MTTMKLEINDPHRADIFTHMFQNIKLFTDSVSITFEPDRLYVQGMDSSHVSIFEINLVKEWFDTYEISNPVSIGISTTIFHKILNTRNQEHQIAMTIGEDDPDRISVEFTCDSKGTFNSKGTFDKSFHMPLMDLDTDRMLIPETEYDLEFTIGSKKMKSIVDELSHFGDTIGISFADDSVLFVSDTAAEGAMKLKASLDDFDTCTVDDEAVIDCGYATRYIQCMTHFYKLNKTCSLFVKSGIPLQFKYPIEGAGEGGEGGEEDGEGCEEDGEGCEISNQNYVRFYLAPKITDEE